MLDYYKFSFDGKIYSERRHRSCMFNFHADHHTACGSQVDGNEALLQCQQGSNHSDDSQGKLS